MYCQALGGEDVSVESSDNSNQDNIGWVSTETSSSYGNMVFLPSRVDIFQSKIENFSMMQIMNKFLQIWKNSLAYFRKDNLL